MTTRPTLAAAIGAVLILVSCVGLASADKFAGDYMALGAGARALGMGGAFSAVASDASTIYWNPAGMSGFEKRQLMLMHSEQFGDLINYNFGSYVNPTGLVSKEREGTWGIALAHMGADENAVTNHLQYTDVDGDGAFTPGVDRFPDSELAKIRWESHNDYALYGGFALKTGWGRIGGNLKLLFTSTLDDESATGVGMDLGYLYRGVIRNLDLAVKLQDITGTYISWSTGHNEYIAPSVKLGAAYTIESSRLNGKMILAADGDVYFEDRRDASQFWVETYSVDFHLGVELVFQEKVMVRGGLDADNPTAGAGFKIGFFGFDYAYLHHDSFEATNRVSAFVEF